MLSIEAGAYSAIIRQLAACRKEADQLDLRDLSRLIDMAIFQAAMDWEGAEPGSNKETNLDALLRLKMKLAFSERNDNVVVLTSKTAGEA